MIKRCFATERSVVPQMTFTASGTFEFTKSPSTLIISSGIVNKDERKISGSAKMHPIDADPAASVPGLSASFSFFSLIIIETIYTEMLLTEGCFSITD